MKLKDRDPRNKAHVQAALKIIQTKSSARVTSEGAAVLALLGLSPAANVMVSDSPRKDEVAVCSFFFIEEGLLMSSNVILPCYKCGVLLQMRPSSADIKRRICVFCAAEEIQQQAAKARQSKAKTSTRSRRGARPSR